MPYFCWTLFMLIIVTRQCLRQFLTSTKNKLFLSKQSSSTFTNIVQHSQFIKSLIYSTNSKDALRQISTIAPLLAPHTQSTSLSPWIGNANEARRRLTQHQPRGLAPAAGVLLYICLRNATKKPAPCVWSANTVITYEYCIRRAVCAKNGVALGCIAAAGKARSLPPRHPLYVYIYSWIWQVNADSEMRFDRLVLYTSATRYVRESVLGPCEDCAILESVMNLGCSREECYGVS